MPADRHATPSWGGSAQPWGPTMRTCFHQQGGDFAAFSQRGLVCGTKLETPRFGLALLWGSWLPAPIQTPACRFWGTHGPSIPRVLWQPPQGTARLEDQLGHQQGDLAFKKGQPQEVRGHGGGVLGRHLILECTCVFIVHSPVPCCPGVPTATKRYVCVYPDK